MSKSMHRHTAPRDRDSIARRLSRLLETTPFARVVPHLPPETLLQLIQYRGLDACGELVTSATPAQLASVLDLDLWRPAQPKRDERFDVERFGEWLEMLVDTGDSVAARTIAALDTNLVVGGLSRYVRVFDPGIFEPTAQSDDEPTDRDEAMREGDSIDIDNDSDGERPEGAWMHDSSTERLQCEVGGYLVRARRTDAWDAVVTLLVTLDAEQHDYFDAVMQGCRRLSNSRPENDGLDHLLLAPEQQLHDLTTERERRRAQQGYATPADARAFLQMARQREQAHSGTRATGPANPLVTAYFRAAMQAPERPKAGAQPRERTLKRLTSTAPRSASTGTAEMAASIDAVIELLAEAGMMPRRSRGLLDAGGGDSQVARLARVRQLMAYVRDADESAYLTRSHELAFLANTLLAGCSVQSRPFTPQEAFDAAASICNLGLEYWPARWSEVKSTRRSTPVVYGRTTGTPSDIRLPDSLLIDHSLVTAFEAGWSVLHHDVSLFVAQRLIATLDDLHHVDRTVRSGLVALRRKLAEQLDAGTPWLARDAADVLSMLDMTAWASVLGLLDECPVLPAALTAILERRTGAVSATAFDFISTPAQIEVVRTFMRKLPDTLAG